MNFEVCCYFFFLFYLFLTSLFNAIVNFSFALETVKKKKQQTTVGYEKKPKEGK